MEFKDSNGEVLEWGDRVLVDDDSLGECQVNQKERMFIGIDSHGKYVTEDSTCHFRPWNYVVGVKKLELVPWTFKTCPLPPFTIQIKGAGAYRVVTQIGEEYVNIADVGRWSFETIMRNYDYIPNKEDRNNILPCGVAK